MRTFDIQKFRSLEETSKDNYSLLDGNKNLFINLARNEIKTPICQELLKEIMKGTYINTFEGINLAKVIKNRK